jgi:FkbM family methyltransferase
MMLRRIRGHHIWPAPLNSESVVIDAGAHRGEFSATIIADYGCRCFLVEANPVLAAELKVPGAAAVISAALAGHNGRTPFHLNANPESGSILSSDNPAVARPFEVETISLPTLMNRLQVNHIDLLKLDIEGAEFEVIGTTPENVLRNVAQMTIEFHDFQPRFAGQGLVEKARRRLKRLGFISCVMSFRTNGDVLFLNREKLQVGAIQSIYARHFARFAEKTKEFAYRDFR